MMIGVHGPDFAGQNPVAAGVKDYKMVYPVLDDASKQVWKQYGITGRPAWALIGKDGTLIKRQIGLVTRPEVKQQIEDALK